MELISEENGKKVFIDDEQNEYIMIDMGYYIGHKEREWYQEPTENWQLMSVKQKQADDSYTFISALVDDTGKYQNLDIQTNDKITRTITLRQNYVYRDEIFESTENLGPLGIPSGKKYTAFDAYGSISKSVPLNEYLTTSPVFKSEDGIEAFSGEIPSNELIVDFLNKNEELIELINNNVKSR